MLRQVEAYVARSMAWGEQYADAQLADFNYVAFLQQSIDRRGKPTLIPRFQRSRGICQHGKGVGMCIYIHLCSCFQFCQPAHVVEVAVGQQNVANRPALLLNFRRDGQTIPGWVDDGRRFSVAVQAKM